MDVYRRLPSAPRYEYGGYLTRNEVRYFRGFRASVYVPGRHACTFHSHPTASPAADVPSDVDVYSFLVRPERRTITVGATVLWV